MYLLEPRLIDVRVDLRGRDIGMAKHFLDHTQISAVVQQMRGKAVAQQVRMHACRINTAQRRAFLDDLLDA